MVMKLSVSGKGEINCKLTPLGEQKIRLYLQTLKTQRVKIINAGLDTAEDYELPTFEDIVADIPVWFGYDMFENEYCNGWGVTDNLNADFPLCLSFGKHIVEAD